MILTGQRFVPVIVLDDARQAVPLAEALLRGGPGIRAQGDLGAADAAAEQGFGEGHCVPGIIEHDDGDEALAGKDHRPSQPPSTGRITPET